MDNNLDVLQKFEIKLMSSMEEMRVLQIQNEELDKRLMESNQMRQRLLELYESEVEKCRQFNDLLIRSESEAKIAIESQTMALNEENRLNETYIQRLEEDNNRLKQQISSLQKKDFQYEQKVSNIENELKKQNTFKTTIGSEMTRIETRIESLQRQYKDIEDIHNQFQDIVKNDSNVETKEVIKQQNHELIVIENEKRCLTEKYNELMAKFCRNEDKINEYNLSALRLSQQNHLQNEEIVQLRQSLKESFDENEVLMKRLNDFHINSFQLSESEVNTKELSETVEDID